MSLRLDLYKVFYTVARCQSITAAAKALYLTQPTVSRCIQNLEEDLGCVLFVRSKRGVCLTPEAEMLMEHVSQAFSHLREAEVELSARKALKSGLVRLGVSEMTMHNYLLPFLEIFQTLVS